MVWIPFPVCNALEHPKSGRTGDDKWH